MKPQRREAPRPTGRERPWGLDEVIVSKTDVKGRITYANDVFLRVAEMTEKETLGQPHNIIRNPEMPRCIFKLLWDRIEAGHEIFAYVVNMAKSGDHYWVFAHVTPSFDEKMNIVGYHSNRRKPDPAQVAKIKPIYAQLLAEESRHTSPKEGLAASYALFQKIVEETGMSYDEFVFSL